MNPQNVDIYTLSLGRQTSLLRQEYWSLLELWCLWHVKDPEAIMRAIQGIEQGQRFGSEDDSNEEIQRCNFWLGLTELNKILLKGTQNDSGEPNFNGYLRHSRRKLKHGTLKRIIEEAIEENKKGIKDLVRSKQEFKRDGCRSQDIDGLVFDYKQAIVLLERTRLDIATSEERDSISAYDNLEELPIIGGTSIRPKIFTRENRWFLHAVGRKAGWDGVIDSIVRSVDAADQNRSMPPRLCFTLHRRAWCQLLLDAGQSLPGEWRIINQPVRRSFNDIYKKINEILEEEALLLSIYLDEAVENGDDKLFWGGTTDKSGSINRMHLRKNLLDHAHDMGYPNSTIPEDGRLAELIDILKKYNNKER
jgi:hypothetical protein